MTILKWFGRLIITCCVIFVAWGTWYTVYQSSLAAVSSTETTKSAPPLAVEVVTARKELVEEQIVLVGSLLPASQTEIRSRVDGYIRELAFDVGDWVNVGDVICQLDDSKQREALQQAAATLDAAKAQLGVQQSEYELARRNVDREELLAQRGASTSQDVETAQANLEIAKARVKLEESHVAEAEANVSALKIALKEFQLVSPITGFVASRLVDIGDLAKPDLPLLHLVDLKSVRTTVSVIEKDYSKVDVGQKAVVVVDAYSGKEFVGEVDRISPIVDPETRTASIQIRVQNPELLLKPGMYARVKLNSDRSKLSNVIPLAAVVDINDRSYVYVVNGEEKTELRQIELGMTDGLMAEVRLGLEAGERVITLGNRMVQPSQTVIAQEVAWAPHRTLADGSPGIETAVIDETLQLSGE